MKDNKHINQPEAENEAKKNINETGESSVSQSANEDAQPTSPEPDKNTGSESTEPGSTVTENAEGASFQSSISGSAEGAALEAEGDAGSEKGASSEPDEGAQPERVSHGCYDPETTAEFAESLTPGEETLFKASEETAAEIAEEAGEQPVKPEEKENTSKSSSGAGYYLRVAGTLTLICACIALLLAFVNSITVDRIAENRRREAEAAISSLFKDFDLTEEIEKEFSAPVTGITSVKKGGETVGYCVFASPKGFGGEVSIAVGVSPGHKVTGVLVLNMRETPGVGTLIAGESFLNQFKGKTSDITFGGDIDALAGATVSSRAVYVGVKAALDELAGVSEPAEIDEEASATKETDGEASATPETDGEASATAETDAEASATENSAETDDQASATPETDSEASATNDAEGGGE
ncbi:MAG: RnfABCDGE type electron transport complex subunit G [Clostridiales bacterium]|nr:RnfABCDGE type electron transport complex subunit G [Clostridiales bacterium]